MQIELSHGAERFVLYVRLWSNAANVILCDENNVVVDSLYRRPAKGEVTGGLFTVPEEKPSENRVWQVRTFDDVQAEYSSLRAERCLLIKK